MTQKKRILRKGGCLQIESEMRGVLYSFTIFGKKMKSGNVSAHFSLAVYGTSLVKTGSFY